MSRSAAEVNPSITAVGAHRPVTRTNNLLTRVCWRDSPRALREEQLLHSNAVTERSDASQPQ